MERRPLGFVKLLLCIWISTDKETHISYSRRCLYSLCSLISKEPGPRQGAPKGQFRWQDPVKGVPLQQDQEEDGHHQHEEEQTKSPVGRERAQAEQRPNWTQLFPTTLFKQPVGPCTASTGIPLLKAEPWPPSPQGNSPQPRSDLAPPCRQLLILQPGQTGTCVGARERMRCGGLEPSLVPTELSAPMPQHRADPSLPKAHCVLPAAQPPSPPAVTALYRLPAPPSPCH